jgi:RNA polymerase sigma factor (sigma-70 family)
MSLLSLNKVATQLRQASLPSDGSDLSDGQLLAQFIGQHDEAAFEALVKRHGPMVLGVCRRLIGNPHDTDDAFQATFLILVHKAASLKSCELVGNWLYGVAYNTALAVRAKNNRRRSKEKQVMEMPEPAETPPDDWSDLRPLLDQELSRLADVYREAIVLCDLEGKTRKEAAQKVGIPEGTMSSRLTTARRQLAKRLMRRGLTLSGSTVATILAQGALTACVPTPLVASTVKSAAIVAAGSAIAGAVSASVVALTEGVLKTMFLTKVKPVTAVALALFLAAGLLVVGYSVAAPIPAQDKQESKKEQPAPSKDEKKDATKEEKSQTDGNKDLETLAGTWNIDTMGSGDQSLPKELMKGYKFVFAGNKLTWEAAISMTKTAGQISVIDGAFPCDFKIDPSKMPKEIDITMHQKQGDRTMLGIYEIKGDELKVCYYSNQSGRRPTDFSNKDNRRITCITLTRAKKEATKEEKSQLDGNKDLESLSGTWNIDTMVSGDQSLPKELMKGYKFVFAINKLTWEAAISMTKRAGQISVIDGAFPCDFKIDSSKNPKEIDITLHQKQGDRTFLGIYEVKGDELKVCYYTSQNGRRPIDFSNKDDRRITCITLTRAKK